MDLDSHEWWSRERAGGGVCAPHSAADGCRAPGVKGRATGPRAKVQSGSYLPLITYSSLSPRLSLILTKLYHSQQCFCTYSVMFQGFPLHFRITFSSIQAS